MSAVRVLVVDDEMRVCNSCMKTLKSEGYTVDYALNGEEALEKVADGNFDLVVTDLKMPKVDGMQLLRRVKEKWPDVNVVMITGYGTIRSAVEAIKLGAFDYLSKPFTSEELAGVAARALGRTAVQRSGKDLGICMPAAFDDLKGKDLDRMWCIPEHVWMCKEDEGTVRIGIDCIYRRLLEADVITVEIVPVGRNIAQGEACATLMVDRATQNKGLQHIRHNLWCPVGGLVVEHNEAATTDPVLLSQSPYGRGWLLRLEPSSLEGDIKNLKPFTETIAGRIARRHLAASVA